MNPTEPERLRVAVFASGRGSNLKALLDAKAAGRLSRVDFAVVVSDFENPGAFEHALAHGVPTLHVNPKAFKKKCDFEEAVIKRLREHRVNFIVLAGYMRIVGAALLEEFPQRIINIHPSLLPAFPGLHAQKQAVEHGVKVAGCTVHFVDAGTDSGPVILQRAVECRDDDTEDSLAARILEQEHQALPQALEWISEGRVRIERRTVLIRRD